MSELKELKPCSKSFGKVLKEKRIAKGWSQAELAEKLNTMASTISGYERNARTPNIYMAYDIASVLQCELEELIGLPSKARRIYELMLGEYELYHYKEIADEIMQKVGVEINNGT